MRLAIVAHKGGAGKTTVAVNLAAALAEAGRSVTLIDCDPQGGTTAALAADSQPPTTYELLRGEATLREATRDAGGLRIVPATIDLAAADIELPRRDGWQLALREATARATGDLVLDTAPGLGVLPFVAMAAATHVIIVTPPEFLALRSLPLVLDTLADVRRAVAPKLATVGIVPTMTTRRSRHERDVLDVLAESYPSLLLPDIPRRVAVADAAMAGVPITTSAPQSDIAAAFRTLAAEVLRRAR